MPASGKSIDEALDRLSELAIQDANEADTRQKLIDHIIYEILEWEPTDISFELRTSEDGKTQYLDYLLQTAQSSILIEAKRIGKDFSSLPKNRSGLMKEAWNRGDVKACINQARDYGRSKGVGFCICTNGDSWILFPINRRDLITFEDSNAVIFGSIKDDIRPNIDEFYELFSRSSVIDGSLENKLLGTEKNQIDTRRLNEIYDHAFADYRRNSVFKFVEDELTAAFSEDLISTNSELLEKSYVSTPQRIRFDERIRMNIRRKDHVWTKNPIKPLRKDGMAEASSLIERKKISTRPIALLCLGLVGAGKTTFLNYVRNVSASEHFKEVKDKPSPHWVYVDFRDFASDESPSKLIAKTIFEYCTRHPFLKDGQRCVQFAYKDEIDGLKAGALSFLNVDDGEINRKVSDFILEEYKNKEPYARKIIKYAALNSPVFLIIDNVDQIVDEKVQARIFLDSLSFARSENLNLILSMRDSTYIKNRNSPIFDAFDFDQIYIDAPNIQSVLSKRFTIAKELLSGKSFNFDFDGKRFIVDDASILIDVLSESILNTEVGRIIEICATGDTRLALRMTRQFLQYGYSSSEQAVGIYLDTGKYRLPPHEALRAVLFGNQSIYKDEFSPIGNPFDARFGKSETQFLRIYILSVLVSAATDKRFDGLDAENLIENLEKIGFGRRSTIDTIKQLIEFRLIFTKSHQPLSDESMLIPSRFAGYMVRDLISQLTFIENVLFDTFISDDELWTKIKSSVKMVQRTKDRVKKLEKRAEISTLFFKYINLEVQKIVDEALRRGLSTIYCSNPLEAARSAFERNIETAIASANRNYGQSDRKAIGSEGWRSGRS